MKENGATDEQIATFMHTHFMPELPPMPEKTGSKRSKLLRFIGSKRSGATGKHEDRRTGGFSTAGVGSKESPQAVPASRVDRRRTLIQSILQHKLWQDDLMARITCAQAIKEEAARLVADDLAHSLHLREVILAASSK